MKVTMQGRRGRLRELTASAHARLDAHVDHAGFFSSEGGYRRYLVATWRARQRLEPQLDLSGVTTLFPLWPERLLLASLGQDLNDVGESTGGPPASRGGAPLSVAAVLGTLYVLEGSALGARVIERRVSLIGMTPQFGARHLARQTARHGAWAHFIELLEGTVLTAEMEDDCAASALATFAGFEREYGAVG